MCGQHYMRISVTLVRAQEFPAQGGQYSFSGIKDPLRSAEHTGAKAASGLLEKLGGIGRETFLDALKGVSQVARSREMHASNDSGIVTYSKGSGFGLL